MSDHRVCVDLDHNLNYEGFYNVPYGLVFISSHFFEFIMYFSCWFSPKEKLEPRWDNRTGHATLKPVFVSCSQQEFFPDLAIRVFSSKKKTKKFQSRWGKKCPFSSLGSSHDFQPNNAPYFIWNVLLFDLVLFVSQIWILSFPPFFSSQGSVQGLHHGLRRGSWPLGHRGRHVLPGDRWPTV